MANDPNPFPFSQFLDGGQVSGLAVQLSHGRIVLPKVRNVHTFMFNPTEVKTNHKWKWGKHSVVGHSHNILSGGSGEDEPITFTLLIDGDRGRSDRRRVATAGSGDVGFDISDELNFYRSLTYPEQPSGTGFSKSFVSGATPPSFILTLGSFFTRQRAVAEDIEIQVTAFTPQLAPLRARIEMKLLVAATMTVYASDIGGGPDDDASTDLTALDLRSLE